MQARHLADRHPRYRPAGRPGLAARIWDAIDAKRE
jgi:hypothetical protein